MQRQRDLLKIPQIPLPDSITEPVLHGSHVVFQVKLAVDDGVVEDLAGGGQLAGEHVLVLVNQVHGGLA